MHLKAVIFDFDGTLTVAGSINFPKIREEINCPEYIPILEYIKQLTGKAKEKALRTVDRYEMEAAEYSQEAPNVRDIINYLKKKNIPRIIVSRNSRKSVLIALENFRETDEKDFYKIISRNDPFQIKPHPESIVYIMKELNISTDEILIVGDYIHDIEAGRRAGIKTIYVQTGRPDEDKIESDHSVSCLIELIPLFEQFM